MPDVRLGVVEAEFANIIWANAPIKTRALVDICEKELDWKRTTTYTVLKKLCDRGIFATNDRMVTVLLSKDEVHAIQSEQFIKDKFHDSLPAFLAAFTPNPDNHPTSEELQEIRKLIDSLGDEVL